jgi:hypothetical protein
VAVQVVLAAVEMDLLEQGALVILQAQVRLKETMVVMVRLALALFMVAVVEVALMRLVQMRL